MQLNVEPVSTKQFIVLPKIVALIKLLSKGVDAKIVGNSLVFERFIFEDADLFFTNFCSFCCF